MTFGASKSSPSLAAAAVAPFGSLCGAQTRQSERRRARKTGCCVAGAAAAAARDACRGQPLAVCVRRTATSERVSFELPPSSLLYAPARLIGSSWRGAKLAALGVVASAIWRTAASSSSRSRNLIGKLRRAAREGHTKWTSRATAAAMSNQFTTRIVCAARVNYFGCKNFFFLGCFRSNSDEDDDDDAKCAKLRTLSVFRGCCLFKSYRRVMSQILSGNHLR